MKIDINKEYTLIVPKGTKIEILECQNDLVKEECLLMEKLPPLKYKYEPLAYDFSFLNNPFSTYGSSLPFTKIAYININEDKKENFQEEI